MARGVCALESSSLQCYSPLGLQVTSLPSVLFQSNGGLHNVVEGSVIQLYCSVESTRASFSWTKDESPVIIDVPHLRERTSNDSTTTTSVLTVDNFQSTDTGTYQCSASDGMRTGNGANVTLNGKVYFRLLVKALKCFKCFNCSLPFIWWWRPFHCWWTSKPWNDIWVSVESS